MTYIAPKSKKTQGVGHNNLPSWWSKRSTTDDMVFGKPVF